MATTSRTGRPPRWGATIIGAAATALLALALAAPPAQAGGRGVWFTTDEAAFLSHARVVTTETFDEFATPTVFPQAQRRLAFDGVRYRSVPPEDPYFVIRLDGSPARSNALSRNFTSGTSGADLVLTFRNGGSVHALGLRLEPFGYPNQFRIRVTQADGTVASRLLPADTDDTYVGITSVTGMTRVLITQRPDLADGVTTNFSVDDVSRGRITARCHR